MTEIKPTDKPYQTEVTSEMRKNKLIEELRVVQWKIDAATYHEGKKWIPKRDEIMAKLNALYGLDAFAMRGIMGGEIQCKAYLAVVYNLQVHLTKALRIMQNNEDIARTSDYMISETTFYTYVDLRDKIMHRMIDCCGRVHADLLFTDIIKSVGGSKN